MAPSPQSYPRVCAPRQGCPYTTTCRHERNQCRCSTFVQSNMPCPPPAVLLPSWSGPLPGPAVALGTCVPPCGPTPPSGPPEISSQPDSGHVPGRNNLGSLSGHLSTHHVTRDVTWTRWCLPGLSTISSPRCPLWWFSNFQVVLMSLSSPARPPH